jgi:hypothetical protein
MLVCRHTAQPVWNNSQPSKTCTVRRSAKQPFLAERFNSHDVNECLPTETPVVGPVRRAVARYGQVALYSVVQSQNKAVEDRWQRRYVGLTGGTPSLSVMGRRGCT